MKINELLERAVAGWLGRQSTRYREVHEAAVKQFSRELGEIELDDLQYIQLELLENRMAARLARTSTTTYMKHLRVLMRWGVVAGELASLPPFPKIRAGQQNGLTIRPVKEDEYHKMLEVASRRYRLLLECLWYSGLRVSEAVALSWDEGPVLVDRSGRYTRIRFGVLGQKSRRDEICPIAPDFAAWLDSLETIRSGRVCGLYCDSRSATRAIIRIAKRAGVEATAHDFRRAFATKWASKVRPPILMRLMRHKSVQTTMSFYVSTDCDDISQQLEGL